MVAGWQWFCGAARPLERGRGRGTELSPTIRKRSYILEFIDKNEYNKNSLVGMDLYCNAVPVLTNNFTLRKEKKNCRCW
jgi:hypothetical protein